MVTRSGTSIDIRALQQCYNQSAINKAAFDHFAQRQKNSGETTVERLQAVLRGFQVDSSRKDVVDLFQLLEGARCGRFVAGRRGHPSRFSWNVSLVDVGQAAAGETIDVEPLSDSEKAIAEADDLPNDIPHQYVLRPGFEVILRLPRDLTRTEAARLADFVRTLPFGE